MISMPYPRVNCLKTTPYTTAHTHTLQAPFFLSAMLDLQRRKVQPFY